jgi:hypothetical protein
LFGLGIRLACDDQAVLALAHSLCEKGAGDVGVSHSISIIIRAARIDHPPENDGFSLGPGSLFLAQGGITVSADAAGAEGRCTYPPGAATGPDSALAEMIRTLLLFLVAQADRTPLHASAVMLDDTALVLAGRSGSGKSALAMAADRGGLPILSDDTVYVQTKDALRVWAQPRAIHVFEKDAPPDAGGGMRYRSGRWKRALPIRQVQGSAARAQLCVLVKGTDVKLEPMAVEEAVAFLTLALEPGYDFYGPRTAEAIRALARDGCWRLTLSHDPAQAVTLLRDGLAGQQGFHRRYTALAAAIERRFPVADWRLDDVPIWPLARFDLYLDMHRTAFGGVEPRQRPVVLQLAAALARPLIIRWRARRDLAHRLRRPEPAHALLLGDGVSLDKVDGAWQDRFGEPIVAALEKDGKSTVIVQPGDFRRWPWKRATLPASRLESLALLHSLGDRRRPALPGHEAVVAFLGGQGVVAPSLSRERLTRRARLVAAGAEIVGTILDRVKPRIAFAVNAAAGLGPAFMLACRRKAILSVDLQRCPRAGAPMGQGWSALPDGGYATLPSVFWTWDAGEAPALPASPFHRDLHGGHMQLAPFLDDGDPVTAAWDRRLLSFGSAEREIIVALQPIPRQQEIWNALADAMVAAPSGWRWWIRRHPAMRPEQDLSFGRLLSLRGSHVLIDPDLPLPALLRHAGALVSLSSGAAVEAARFGVPALFLSREAQGPFAHLIAGGAARCVAPEGIRDAIACLPARPVRPPAAQAPKISESLLKLEALAREHAQLCAAAAP